MQKFTLFRYRALNVNIYKKSYLNQLRSCKLTSTCGSSFGKKWKRFWYIESSETEWRSLFPFSPVNDYFSLVLQSQNYQNYSLSSGPNVTISEASARFISVLVHNLGRDQTGEVLVYFCVQWGTFKIVENTNFS